MSDKKLAVIGGGQMGRALVGGMLCRRRAGRRSDAAGRTE